MKKTVCAFGIVAAFFTSVALEHPIRPANKNSDRLGTFYVASPLKTGVKCIQNESGNWMIRIDAKDGMKKLVSGMRISLAQDADIKLRIKVKVRSGGVIAAGFYVYDAKSKYMNAVYNPVIKITPESNTLEVSGTVQKNPKATSAFERPSFGFIFMDVKQGCDFDIEKIEYEIVKKASEEKAELPDF